MNDRLKQSLDERLDGMRWGAREQAEVFRLIRQKEMQEVKHIKRGTGILAIAATLLFVIMGAAFALTGTTEPDPATPLASPVITEIVPAAETAEGDAFTLTLDSAVLQDHALQIDVTIRLKDPQTNGLVIDSYANPGGTQRVMLTAETEGFCQLQRDGKPVSASLDTPEVLDMTGDSATIRLTHFDIPLETELLPVHITIALTGGDLRDEATLECTLARSASEVEKRIWLFENELITGWLADMYASGDHLIVTMDVEPRKPWYVINAELPGKSSLTVDAAWYTAFDGATPLTASAVRSPEFFATLEGARTVVAIPFPEVHDSITLSAHITAQDPVSGAVVTENTHHTFTRAERAAEPTAAPLGTLVGCEADTGACPEDNCSEHTHHPFTGTECTAEPTCAPQGLLIGRMEGISVYLEESWFDGFSAEGRLRIRANDAGSMHLTTAPNEGARPDAATWVATINDGEEPYRDCFTYRLSREEATGDLLMDFAYCDLHARGNDLPQSSRYGDDRLTLSPELILTNELTWESHSLALPLTIEPSGAYPLQPLYLLDTTGEDVILQAGLITTDRYHYIGLRQTYGSQYHPFFAVLDGEGGTLAEGSYMGVPGRSLQLFPRALLPYQGDGSDENVHYHVGVARLEKGTTLPMPLTVRLTGEQSVTGKNRVISLGLVMLTTQKPQDTP